MKDSKETLRSLPPEIRDRIIAEHRYLKETVGQWRADCVLVNKVAQVAKKTYKLPSPKVQFSYLLHTPDPWFTGVLKPVGCADCLDELPGWVEGFRGYYPCVCHPNPPAKGSVFTREEIEQWDA